MDPAAGTSVQSIGQTWNTEAYAANGRFVANLASDVVSLLAPKPGERILDLGCGDGALTEQLAATGAVVTGVDASPAMLEAARKRNLNVEQYDATALPFNNQFDAVFSNAALHWITGISGHQATLAGVHRALRSKNPRARFVAEMGGHAISPPSAPRSRPPSPPSTSTQKPPPPASFPRPRSIVVSSNPLASLSNPSSSSPAQHRFPTAWSHG
jgi:SAM-dependent methyltransferase